ncbi:MAG: hypothetical protein FJ271_27990 [Planctomycetes bacterium]|nr:hypothetical protein [Planctomycetota bacterium]
MGRHGKSTASGFGRALFIAAWLFVVLAAAFDGGFAWHFRASFHEWEMNPVARRLAASFGMAGLLSFKSAGVVFAAAVAVACRRLRHRLAVPMTLVVTAVYLLLSLHYLRSVLPLDGSPTQVLALAMR